MKNRLQSGSKVALLALGLCVSTACESSTSDYGDATGGSGGTSGGTGGTSSGGAASGGLGGDTGTGGTPCEGVSLTVKNVLSWCSVVVGGEPAFTTASKTFCVDAGTLELNAKAKVGFKLGDAPWHGTDGDTGAGELGEVTGVDQDAESTVSLTVTGTTACAWICCPFEDGHGCAVPDQCE